MIMIDDYDCLNRSMFIFDDGGASNNNRVPIYW